MCHSTLMALQRALLPCDMYVRKVILVAIFVQLRSLFLSLASPYTCLILCTNIWVSSPICRVRISYEATNAQAYLSILAVKILHVSPLPSCLPFFTFNQRSGQICIRMYFCMDSFKYAIRFSLLFSIDRSFSITTCI